MARHIVWTEPALHDLETATAYIAQDSVHYAAAFATEVNLAAESLAEFAERGQVVPEVGDLSFRELLVRPYRLIYRLTDERVELLAVVHGAKRTHRY